MVNGNDVTAQSMTYGGATTAFLGGLNLNDAAMVIGIIVGIAGLVFQIWLGLDRRKREQQKHNLEIKGIRMRNKQVEVPHNERRKSA